MCRFQKVFFYKCRPKNMRLGQSVSLNQCLCETCTNIGLKLMALKNAFQHLPTSRSAVVDMMLCPKNGEYHKPDCINMKCNACGPDRLKNILCNSPKEKVDCQEWVTKRDEKCSTKKILESKEWSVLDLVEKLVEDLKLYPLHLFTAKWQYKQFNTMKISVGRGEVVKVYDFAENYRTAFQDEIQSAHWTYAQITLHPVVCYYRCSNCDEIITHSVVAVSEDLTHDCFAVDAILRQVDNFLKERGLQFSKSVEWSDGCMAQYKSKGPFWLLQQRGSAEHIIHRHYFGSRHGKNPSDGESAIVKSAVSRAVKCRRAVIQNADDLFQFAVSNLAKDDLQEICQHFKRSFISIKTADISRRKLPVMTALQGTRLLHSIVSANGQEIKYRNLSCSCKGCISGEACTDNVYIEEWKYHSFPVVNKQMAAVLDTSIDDGLNVLSRSTLQYLESLDNDITEESHKSFTTDEQPGTSKADADSPQEANITDKNHQSLDTKDNSQPPTVDNPQKETGSATKTFGGPLLQESCYVEALVYDVHGAWHAFRGIVEKVLHGEISIRFKKCLGGGIYIWPTIDDTALVPIYDICRVLNAPTMVARGR